MGITKVLKSKNFIIAVTKMCLDASSATRWVSFMKTMTSGTAAQCDVTLVRGDIRNSSVMVQGFKEL